MQLLQLYANCIEERPTSTGKRSAKPVFFQEKHISFLLGGLKSEKRIVQKRVLKCIWWALIQSEHKIILTSEQHETLITFVEAVVNDFAGSSSGKSPVEG